MCLTPANCWERVNKRFLDSTRESHLNRISQLANVDFVEIRCGKFKVL